MAFSMDLSGRVALVTGASGGLGAQFAKTLSRAGAAVVLASRRLEKLKELRAEIEAEGGHAHAVLLDVTDQASIKSGVAHAETEVGPIDLLVNNSGVSTTQRLQDVDEEDYDFIFNTNVKGAFFVAQEVGKRMLARAKGAADGVAPHFWRGIACAMASLACWTAFAILNSAWLKRHPQVNATDWANWLGVATGLGALLMWLAAGSDVGVLAGREDRGSFVLLCVLAGFGSTWLATILWNLASQRLSASLCGQLIVSETIFALLYSFAWDGHWPTPGQFTACALFALGILSSIRAHR